MLLKIEKTRFLTFCDAILALVPECRVWLNKEGIEVRVVDVSNVAMVNAKMPVSAFYGYEESSDPFGFDLKQIKTACSFMMAGELMIAQDEKGKIHITDGGRYDYEYTPLDVNTIRKDPNPPELSLPATVTVNAKEFQESISAMSKIGDKIHICLKDKTLTMITDGDLDRLTGETPCEVTKPIKEQISSLFSSEFLIDVGKVIKNAEIVTVSLGTDHPIKMICEVDQITLEYLIAPRIETE